VSELSRQLGINRTQFNRYLSGESFPRPDVLARICDFFAVDARILLEPVGELKSENGLMSNDYLNEFMGSAVQSVSEKNFPSGFYRFTRRSFVKEAQFVRGLVLVSRDGPYTFLRGYEAKAAMVIQGLPTDLATREFRGFVLQLEDGVAATVSRTQGLTASFNYLSRVASFENNFWVGYVARTVREQAGAHRMTRLVYEYIGRRAEKVLPAARQAGICDFSELMPFHQRLLQPNDPLF
jgi:transcriptional regulator with XRE-family HTH domain